ncbi:hypothetical protein EVAR_86652_1 [Eumeta japonica]|uniref:Uncharacterized protein n=1 Tax=Eumeta variegata TaxID=151549 RepID=A0A4C1Z1S8_EUMVA|nr:hypothetical protein EVAR_86652_1 [Eumeta japonica]
MSANNEHGLPDCGEFVVEYERKMGRARMCFRCLRAVTCKPRRGKPCVADIIGYSTKSGPRERVMRERPDDSRRHRAHGAQTIRNLKLAPQRVERATVAACSHLTDIAENLIYDAAAPCILIGQDNWGLIVSRQIKRWSRKPACRLLDSTGLGYMDAAPVYHDR